MNKRKIVAAGAVAAVLAMAAAEPSYGISGPCAPKGAKGVTTSTKVKVYRLKGAWFACYFSENNKVQIADSSSKLTNIRIVKQFVGFVQVKSGNSSVAVWSARSGKRSFSDAASGSNQVFGIQLTQLGTLGWIEGPSASSGPWTVMKHDIAGAQQLDQGNGIVPTSLGLSRSSELLYWINGGVAKSAPIS